MARGIQNFPNVIAPDADYLDGDVKDAPNGTPVNKLTMSDIYQFFAKVMREAGLTFNNLPDNESNGYQLYAAAVKASRPYDVYTARLTQSGTNDPVMTIAENSLSGVPAPTRSSTGLFLLTLAGEFDLARQTVCFAQSQTLNRTTRIQRNNDDEVVVSSVDNSGALADTVTCDIEIRVYR